LLVIRSVRLPHAVQDGAAHMHESLIFAVSHRSPGRACIGRVQLR
jgi:hypothetical protein